MLYDLSNLQKKNEPCQELLNVQQSLDELSDPRQQSITRAELLDVQQTLTG